MVQLGRTGEPVLNPPGTTTAGAAQATTVQALQRTVRVASLGGATIVLLCIVTDEDHAETRHGEYVTVNYALR